MSYPITTTKNTSPYCNASPWDHSAEIYADLAPKISFYRETSERIVEAARLQTNMTVVDLACGSSTLATRHMLANCPDLNRIYCVDSSQQMIAVASKHLSSPIVEYLVCPAESIDQLINNSIDRIICNSAFWMLDAPQVLRAVKNLLGINGQLLFNLAEWDFNFGDTANQPRYTAINDQLRLCGLPPKTDQGTPKKYSLEEVQQILTATGFSSITHTIQEIEVSAEDWKNFYRIPTIASKSLPFLPERQAIDILSKSMMTLQDESLPPLRWITFSAQKSKSL